LISNFFKKDQQINVDLINKLLFHCNITITKKQLIELINLPKYSINMKDINETNKEIQNLVGLPSSKSQVSGVYIFTHKVNGSKYVGSSSQLAIRLRSHMKNKDKISGLFIPLFRKEKIYNFNLDIIPIINH
jgi:hypothetical protein